MTAQNKIYVGNLPYNTTDEDLKSFFGACGEIVDAIIISKVIKIKFSTKSLVSETSWKMATKCNKLFHIFILTGLC